MYHVGLLMYKFYNRMLPIVFDEMFTSNSDLYSYHTRQHDLLHVPLYRTQLGLNSFNYQAVTIWNFIFLKDNSLLRPKTFQLVKIDKNLVIGRSTCLVYGSKIKK